ncbi:MAG: hypothetical protein ACK4UU_05050 [Fimbriimonadales bacterium]
MQTEFHILSEADEARWSFLSVAHDSALGVGGQTLAVLDIGGGSVEVALGREEVAQWFSFPLGAGRLRETLLPSDPPNEHEVRKATRSLDKAFEPLRALSPPERIVSIGGTGVNLAMLVVEAPRFDPALAHGAWIAVETLRALRARLMRLSDAERRALPAIEPDRAPLLHIGALILERALLALQGTAIQVSTRGLRYGILWSIGSEYRNPENTSDAITP